MYRRSELTIAESVAVLGDRTNEDQIHQWTHRGVLTGELKQGRRYLPLVDVIRAAILLDLQTTLGPTSGLAADVARALTPGNVMMLFESDAPTIRVDTDNGQVIFMPDPEVFEEVRGRLARL